MAIITSLILLLLYCLLTGLCWCWTTTPTHSFVRSSSNRQYGFVISSSDSRSRHVRSFFRDPGCMDDDPMVTFQQQQRRRQQQQQQQRIRKKHRSVIVTTPTKLLFSSCSNHDDDDSVGEDINGKMTAATIRQEIKEEVTQIKKQHAGIVPGLAVLLVGSRRDSQTYVNMKKKACEEVGFVSFGYDYNDTVSEEILLDQIDKLNSDNRVHGILVQLPLPKHIDPDTILQAVTPEKDVDGLHPLNVAQLSIMKSSSLLPAEAPTMTTTVDYSLLNFSIPCTPLGCIELLDRYGVPIAGKNAVVMGRSNLVGLPMFKLLLDRDATVTIVHSKTGGEEAMKAIVQQADIVIVAIGKALFVQGDWFKKGAVVIDVGMNSVDITPTKPGGKAYKLVGDVDYETAKQVCSKITPVPGGVGPMTIAMLLRNTLNSCKRFHSIR